MVTECVVVINTFTDPICPTPTTMSTELTAGSPTIITESGGNSPVYFVVVIVVAVVVIVVIICALFFYKKKFASKIYNLRYVLG